MWLKPLLLAIGFVGSRSELARRLKVSSQRVNAWLNNYVAIPYEYALAIECLTNGLVRCAELAPEKHRVAQMFAPVNQTFPIISAEVPTPTKFISADGVTETVSQRVAKGLQLEQKLGNRQGQRVRQTLRPNSDEVKGRTDTRVAKEVGFSSRFIYREAKKAIQKGCAALVTAMDNGIISISAAALLAQLSWAEQEDILMRSKKEIIASVQYLRGNSL